MFSLLNHIITEIHSVTGGFRIGAITLSAKSVSC